MENGMSSGMDSGSNSGMDAAPQQSAPAPVTNDFDDDIPF